MNSLPINHELYRQYLGVVEQLKKDSTFKRGVYEEYQKKFPLIENYRHPECPNGKEFQEIRCSDGFLNNYCCTFFKGMGITEGIKDGIRYVEYVLYCSNPKIILMLKPQNTIKIIIEEILEDE